VKISQFIKFFKGKIMIKSTLIKSALMALAIVFAIGLNSCTKDDVITPDGGPLPMMNSDYNSTSNYIMATYNAEESFIPATIDKEMEYVDMEAIGGGEKPPMPPKGMFLGDIFRKMKVTREQMKEFHLFIQAFEKCSRETQTLSPDQVRALIKEANEKVKAIIALVREGKVSREDAKVRIEEINKALRTKLESTVDQAARCECLRELFRKIYSKLTDAQKAIWDEWKSRQQNPCFGAQQ
jgi:polyhydroxyalkanoate synthesis regulator phasin